MTVTLTFYQDHFCNCRSQDIFVFLQFLSAFTKSQILNSIVSVFHFIVSTLFLSAPSFLNPVLCIFLILRTQTLNLMEVTSIHGNCILSPLRSSSHRPLSVLSRVSFSARRNPSLASNYHSIRRRNLCSASSSDTLVAGKDGKPKNREVVNKKGEEEGEDLKSWMHNNGLPPCKVLLKERPSHDEKHSPIHYVAASEDLQVWNLWSLWLFLRWVWFGLVF